MAEAKRGQKGGEDRLAILGDGSVGIRYVAGMISMTPAELDGILVQFSLLIGLTIFTSTLEISSVGSHGLTVGHALWCLGA
jgi:hypothetical protein